METVSLSKHSVRTAAFSVTSAELRGGEAAGHQQAGGLVDIVGVPVHAGPGGHVLLVQLLQGGDEVPPGLLAADVAMSQKPRMNCRRFVS